MTKNNIKIIILLMCYKNDKYEEYAETLKLCYEKLISKYHLNDSIKVFSYIGNNNIQEINNDIILCKSLDDLNNTYQKTIECFEIVNKSFDYDYIVRTNCTQFINIKLMYEFLKRQNNDYIIYTGGLSCSPNYTVIHRGDININGNFMIFHKKIIKTILNFNHIITDLRKKYKLIGTQNNGIQYDDLTISAILIMYFNTDNYRWKYLDNIKCVEQGFYECYDSNKPYEGTDLCDWQNNSLDFNFMKKFMSIRMKSNTSCNKDINTKIQELCEMYLNNDDNSIQESIDRINRWAQNPNVGTDWWNQCIYTKLNNLIHKIEL